MNIIKAVYNFLVGDMIILIGVIITVGVTALINGVSIFAPLRVASGAILIAAILAVLIATLSREARGNR
jgi:membrane protein implicated in regulation of membrane protease activity